MSDTVLEKILEFCCKNKNTSFKLDDIKNEPNLIHEFDIDIISSLNRARSLFIINQACNKYDIKIEIDLKICNYYNQREGCEPICSKLHVCLNSILSYCNDANCKLEHDINSEFNSTLLLKNGLNVNSFVLLNFYRVIQTYY
jgi:hypothetical protein